MIFKEHIGKQFTEALYGDLTGQSLADFEDHLAICPKCRLEYQELKDTTGMIRADLADPVPNRLDDFWERLKPRLEAEPSEPPKSQIRQIFPLANYRYSAVASIAAAILLVITGVFLGRVSLSDNGQTTTARYQTAAFAPAEIADFQNLLTSYLSRSKALMLGMEHMKIVPDSGIDLDGQRKLSRALLRAGRRLSSHRVAASNPQVANLVAELETLLLQLANSIGDDQNWTVKMIQDGLDQKSIIFQITLTEIGQD